MLHSPFSRHALVTVCLVHIWRDYFRNLASLVGIGGGPQQGSIGYNSGAPQQGDYNNAPNNTGKIWLKPSTTSHYPDI